MDSARVSEIVATLQLFTSGAIAQNDDAAWSGSVRDGRKNSDVSEFVATLQAPLDSPRLQLIPNPSGIGGFDIEVTRDDQVASPYGPPRRFTQMMVGWTIDGVHTRAWEKIEPSNERVVFEHRASLIVVNNLIGGFDPGLTFHEVLKEALLQGQKVAQERQAIAAASEAALAGMEAQRRAALRVAMEKDRKKRP